MTSRGATTFLLGVFVHCSGCTRADLQVISDDSIGGTGAGRTSVGGVGTTNDSSGHAGAGRTSSGGVGGGSNSSATSARGGVGASTSDTSQTTSSCPLPALPAGDTNVTLQVGSLSRSYVLHVPATYDGTKPVPLVLDFHAIGSTGWGELSSSPYPAVTDPEGVVLAFPDGIKGPAGTAWNMGPCCVEDVDDVAFARAVVADVQKTACIDSRRVYAAGVLTGGGMAYYLACHAADEFAAAAPAAFDLLAENVDDCHPTRPITVISFRGDGVSRVPYEGGASSLVPKMPITFLGAEATFARWAQLDGCSGTPSSEDNNGCSSYSGCLDDVEVILCTKPGGREEPGDAAVAWPVLKRHAL